VDAARRIVKVGTLLEVMAEVARASSEVYACKGTDRMSAEEMVKVSVQNIEFADIGHPEERREHLVGAIAWAILALCAHDAEAAKAGS
jgi:hypothetical protein